MKVFPSVFSLGANLLCCFFFGYGEKIGRKAMNSWDHCFTSCWSFSFSNMATADIIVLRASQSHMQHSFYKKKRERESKVHFIFANWRPCPGCFDKLPSVASVVANKCLLNSLGLIYEQRTSIGISREMSCPAFFLTHPESSTVQASL